MNRRGTGPGLYNLENTTHVDFSGMNFIFHLELQRWTLFSVGWMVTSASDDCLQDGKMVTSSSKR